MTTDDMSNQNEAASASGAEQLTTPPDSAPVNEPAAESQRNRLIPILQVGAALVVSIAVVVLLIRYASFVEGLGEWGYAGVFLLQLINSATVVLLPVPGHAVIFAVSGTLNPLLIGLVGAIGAALGEMTAYMAGRGGSSMVDGSKWYKRLETMGTRWRGLAIFAFAATPLAVRHRRNLGRSDSLSHSAFPGDRVCRKADPRNGDRHRGILRGGLPRRTAGHR